MTTMTTPCGMGPWGDMTLSNKFNIHSMYCMYIVFPTFRLSLLHILIHEYKLSCTNSLAIDRLIVPCCTSPVWIQTSFPNCQSNIVLSRQKQLFLSTFPMSRNEITRTGLLTNHPHTCLVSPPTAMHGEISCLCWGMLMIWKTQLRRDYIKPAQILFIAWNHFQSCTVCFDATSHIRSFVWWSTASFKKMFAPNFNLTNSTVRMFFGLRKCNSEHSSYRCLQRNPLSV